jgi:murein DD-endopeptidase MepM/ murein hydrolase activator NlpD
MKNRGSGRGAVLPALAVCFCAGIATGWWLHSGAPLPAGMRTIAVKENAEAAAPSSASTTTPDDRVSATTGEPLIGPAKPSGAPLAAVTADLGERRLRVPIDNASIDAMKGGFAERRDAGGRPHEAVDLLAPRNTPIHAVEDGTIAKLFISKAGGITVYQYDPTGRFCYYYAHLERYADGLHEQQHVSRGAVLGYVGTSGNAPPNTPHLHFAVFELDESRQWWKGRPIDPYLVFTQ